MKRWLPINNKQKCFLAVIILLGVEATWTYWWKAINNNDDITEFALSLKCKSVFRLLKPSTHKMSCWKSQAKCLMTEKEVNSAVFQRWVGRFCWKICFEILKKQILCREQYAGARRCGIMSLGVLILISHKWGQLNTRREFPYLQATMNYFVYYILNTLLVIRSWLHISKRYALRFIHEWWVNHLLAISNLMWNYHCFSHVEIQ